jgi:hypothetical protein
MRIQPIEIPFIGTATTLTVRVLPFTTDDKTCNLYYEITTDDNKTCKQANYTLTEDEFNNWGSDNQYIVDIVLNIPENKGLIILDDDVTNL